VIVVIGFSSTSSSSSSSSSSLMVVVVVTNSVFIGGDDVSGTVVRLVTIRLRLFISLVIMLSEFVESEIEELLEDDLVEEIESEDMFVLVFGVVVVVGEWRS
jgi:hypothetical protein